MEYFSIDGAMPLQGEISVKGAKNSILPIIACCIMIKEEVILRECPHLNDINSMLNIIRAGGGKARYEYDNLIINCKDFTPDRIGGEYTSCLRASLFLLGPLLSAFRRACVCFPGGCEIGVRPFDLHISGLRSLSVVVNTVQGVIECDGTAMKNGEVFLDFPSVGATENLIMASVLTSGKTIIYNCAKEPEVCDLANFINLMGGKVWGAGTDRIIVEGVKSLRGGNYFPIKDRIVTGTYLIAGALRGKEVSLRGANLSFLYPLAKKLTSSGARIFVEKNRIIVRKSRNRRCVKRTETQPYPGFPTDLQPQLTAYLSVCRGYSVVVENLFENRFGYTSELIKMGADITVKDRVAIIKGVKSLVANKVEAKDLRGGASLILASLDAEGTSEIYGVSHVDRGYDAIERDLSTIGAKITRIKV
jgi:UDP-N-acetylglucosamine 1-carboxyvinyltransferase